jgi:hypothetical protein
MDPLRREALESQLAVLLKIRDDEFGQDIDVCVVEGCFTLRGDHGREHQPQYWPISQSIFKLKAELDRVN